VAIGFRVDHNWLHFLKGRIMTGTSRDRLFAAISVYAGGLVIGLTLVSFPASSAYLKQTLGFSDAQYGSIYLPQLVAAVIGAVGGGVATRRLGMRVLFLVSLGCFAIAQLLLFLSVRVDAERALLLIMCATASFGFGFGFGGGPLNAFAAFLFPSRATTAVTALHMTAGAGLTIAPALFAGLAGVDQWQWGPAGLLLTTVILLLVATAAKFPTVEVDDTASTDNNAAGSTFFWICAAVATAYSLAEGTFSNWAILYLQDERAISPSVAAFALTAFWGSLTIGRLIASILVIQLSAATFLFALPILMVAAFLLLPMVETSAQAIAGFALAGLACSAFFPMLVAYTAERFPTEISWIASMLTAAMMVGVGIGSYAVGAFRGSSSIAALFQISIVYPLAVLALLALSRSIGRVRVSA